MIIMTIEARVETMQNELLDHCSSCPLMKMLRKIKSRCLSHDLWSVLGISLRNDRVLKAGAAGPLTDPVHAGHWPPITSSYTVKSFYQSLHPSTFQPYQNPLSACRIRYIV